MKQKHQQQDGFTEKKLHHQQASDRDDSLT